MQIKLNENIVSGIINSRISKPIAAPVEVLLTSGIILRSRNVKDFFELSNSKEINRQIFINDVIKGKDEKVEKVLKKYDFSQYQKRGLPLKISREKFLEDIEKSLKGLSKSEKTRLIEKYNLRLGLADIDGIASLNTTEPVSSADKNLRAIIEKFYYNNECTIKNEKEKRVLNKIVKGMPEFNMTVGKVQHGTHEYSVDIHSLKGLQNALNHKDYNSLSSDGKIILKLSILMHDFGKNGKVVTPGHSNQSEIDAKMILNNYNIDKSIKDRVLNQIKNHHWFEYFCKNIYTSSQVKNIFKTPEDLKIAKIITKSDMESINKTFHRAILIPGKILSQEQFDKEFENRMAQIQFES